MRWIKECTRCHRGGACKIRCAGQAVVSEGDAHRGLLPVFARRMHTLVGIAGASARDRFFLQYSNGLQAVSFGENGNYFSATKDWAPRVSVSPAASALPKVNTGFFPSTGALTLSASPDGLTPSTMSPRR